MINKFTINGTELQVSSEVKNDITINSHPTAYQVVFDNFENTFLDTDVILIDKNVQKIYGIEHSKMIIIEATEYNKSIDTVLNVCEKLLNFEFDRGHKLIVIGGGIIQDIGAYTAKTFKRGINWVYYPTTLLSQCDSCIGGKTALNFKNFKNQLALFSAPQKVVIDTKFLQTLTPSDMLSGYGEIVKLYLIGGDYYIDKLNTFDIKESIFHALSIKKAVVEKDEFENNERKSLNYGHSFGHVIEPLTSYEIPHGEAVMMGIEIINKLFSKSDKITDIIKKYTSLNKIKSIDKDKLVNGLKTDKKVSNGFMTFVVVTEPGNTIFLKENINADLAKKVYEIFTD